MNAESPPAPARLSQAERRARSERRILAAALEVIAEKGLHGMTLAAAGERAGYSRALPTHLFGSRSALLCSCVRRVIVDHWIAGLPVSSDVDGLEAILLAVGRWLDELRARSTVSRAYFLLLHDAMTLDAEAREPELTPLVRALAKGGEDRYRDYIAAGQASGRIRTTLDPAAEARLMHTVLTGISLRWLVSPASVDITAFQADYLERLRRDLAVENP